MGNWDASFLQALGWSTLNSIWQMALLWGAFLIIQQTISLSGSAKYKLAVAGVFIGFGWYLFTFLSYFFNGYGIHTWQAFRFKLAPALLPLVLYAASVTYLLLLIIPIYRVIYNWRFIKKIKSQGLKKAPLPYRLFTQKLCMHLGIGKEIKVFLSTLVTSPITVGFIKPIILLPFAAVNNLSTQQIEAILLHELAHIRRHDYLVNLMLTAIHVTLYFNPFIKAFLKQIEVEREFCCDELVLRFEYDRLAYASALFTLKTSNAQLAMAAANKNHLLHRIEKIVGVSKKRKIETAHFAGVLAGLLMLIAVHLLITRDNKPKASAGVVMDTFSQPSSLFMYYTEAENLETQNGKPQQPFIAAKKTTSSKPVTKIFLKEEFNPATAAQQSFKYASYHGNEAALAAEEKQQVEAMVINTKKVLELQWSEVEKAMADALTEKEKEEAKRDYLQEVATIDWKKLTTILTATYTQRDWNKINSKISEAIASAQLDSVEKNYNNLLFELHKMQSPDADGLMALPDASVLEITKAITQIKLQLKAIRKLREKKIIHL